MGEGGCEDEAEEKVRMEDFMIKIVISRWPGGFDGDGATRGYGNRGNIQTEHDRFIGGPPIGYEIVPAKHTNARHYENHPIHCTVGRVGLRWIAGELDLRVPSLLIAAV